MKLAVFNKIIYANERRRGRPLAMKLSADEWRGRAKMGSENLVAGCNASLK